MHALRTACSAAALAAALVLMGCASEERPKPAPLPENVDLIGVQQAWTASLPKVRFPLEARVVGDRVVLAASDGTVVTLNGATGAELSRVKVGAPLSAGVGSDGVMSAVVTGKNEVVALDATRVLWKHRLETQVYTAPLVAGGRVFVLGADRSVTALDGRTGGEIWQLPRSGDPLVLREAGVLTSVGNVLLAGISGRLTAINPGTGGVVWDAPIAVPRGTNDVERLVNLVAGVDQQGNTLCARAYQAAVGCIDLASGRTLWTHKADGQRGVAGDSERVYGAESDGRVVAWKANNGEEAWATDLLKWRRLTGALVLGRSVVLGDSDGTVYFLARDSGRLLDRVRTGSSGIAATPVVAGDTLVVVTRAGAVHGYRPQR